MFKHQTTQALRQVLRSSPSNAPLRKVYWAAVELERIHLLTIQSASCLWEEKPPLCLHESVADLVAIEQQLVYSLTQCDAQHVVC